MPQSLHLLFAALCWCKISETPQSWVDQFRVLGHLVQDGIYMNTLIKSSLRVGKKGGFSQNQPMCRIYDSIVDSPTCSPLVISVTPRLVVSSCAPQPPNWSLCWPGHIPHDTAMSASKIGHPDVFNLSKTAPIWRGTQNHIKIMAVASPIWKIYTWRRRKIAALY